jgi:hypothetical protein
VGGGFEGWGVILLSDRATVDDDDNDNDDDNNDDDDDDDDVSTGLEESCSVAFPQRGEGEHAHATSTS